MAKKNRKKRRGNGKQSSMAQQMDRYELYELAVQCVEAEIDFVDATFKKLRHRTAYSLREDFCATTNTSCEWVQRRVRNTAWAVDIDPQVLKWAKENRISRLSNEQMKRITLLNSDVLTVQTRQVDMVLAMNFSYWIMKDRKQMVRYFRHVHSGLVEDGILFLDAYGGYEAFQEMEEETEYDDFTYVWDQYHYNPISGKATCKIHFRFEDGSEIEDAFVYEWRLWTLPEITEMLAESGFKATVYWEGTDEDGEGDGVFEPATQGEADAGWISYIVAEKI